MRARLAILALAALAACSSSPADDGEDGDAVLEDDVTAAAPMFGDDRVRAALASSTRKIPSDLAGVEALFGVGRKCARADSKEIYVVEESQARLPSGEVTPAGAHLLPRAVVTGCNTGDLGDPATARRSFSLMVALVSDPAQAERTRGDGIVKRPVEVMALDERSGLFDFYVFDVNAAGKNEVTRIYRDAAGRVVERRIAAGQRTASAPAPPANGSKRCFACHVNGGPLMNEMRDPWTNWISFKKNVALSAATGDTKELVSEAAPNASTGRSALANDLEPVMRAAIRAHVSGGWAKKQDARSLFASVFCQTELNYATRTDSLPMEAFVDPVLASGDLVAPDAFGDVPVPFQMPIRSEHDRAVEGWLVDRGFLSPEIALAIRLVDDENDVFSDARCALHRTLPAVEGTPAQARERIRSWLAWHAARVPWKSAQPKRHAYLTGLLAPRPGTLEAEQLAYDAELAQRFAAMIADPERASRRERDRKARARAMFPGTSTPLPLLDHRGR